MSLFGHFAPDGVSLVVYRNVICVKRDLGPLGILWQGSTICMISLAYTELDYLMRTLLITIGLEFSRYASRIPLEVVLLWTPFITISPHYVFCHKCMQANPDLNQYRAFHRVPFLLIDSFQMSLIMNVWCQNPWIIIGSLILHVNGERDSLCIA